MIGKVILFVLVMALVQVSLAQEKSVDPLVQKINDRPYPEWFKDAKLGIFIHWGLYSVPAYGAPENYSEWFLRGLQTRDSLRINFMRDTYGQNFTYKDFTNHFKAELFDPNEWASFFKNAGARYVVLVSKHHDGYALWPSKYNRNWNSVDTGPKRDIVGELTESVRNSGLKMGLYYSLSEWNHPLHRWYTDPHDSIADYVDQYMIPQFKELVSTYKPSLIFSDGEWANSAAQWHSAELINWYYDLVGDEAIVNNRWGGGIDVGFLTPEYSAGIKVTDRPWAEVRGIGRSFGLNRNEKLEAYGSSKELIQRFIQTVANGGGMIINVGPAASGQIPLLQQERLLALGDWLKINGEAIYGSTPYSIKEEEKGVTMQRIDSTINFDWVRNSPMKGIKEDNFSIDWNGFIEVPQTGKYKFEIDADDEATLLIQNQVVINQSNTAEGTQSEVMDAQTSTEANGEINLKAGEIYSIRLKYKEKSQNASIKMHWSSKKVAKEVVPASAFFQDERKGKMGLSGVYSSLKTYLCYTQNTGKTYAISLEWPEEELVLSIPNPGANATVKMLGLDKELEWEYRGEKMYINTQKINYSEMPSHDAWTFEITRN